MKIKILESAVEDLKRSYDFYEKLSKGLGSYFLNTLFSDIDSLQLYGGIHQNHFGYHRMLSKRFPFAIYYKVREDTVIVYAVLDCRQNPEKIQKRLKF